MDEKRSIPMPTPAERAASIQSILDEGLPEARRPALPLSALFFGVEDCLFLSALLALLGWVPALASARQAPTGSLPALLFLASPALYALPHLLTLWKDAMSGTLEWKRSCRLSLGRLLALRMLAFGGTAAVVSVPAAAVYWAASGRRLSLVWLLGLSFSSLFLYAALSLPLLRRRAALVPPALWLGIGLVLLRWEAGGALLLRVPALVFFLAAGLGLGYCLRTLSGMLRGGLLPPCRYAGTTGV